MNVSSVPAPRTPADSPSGAGNRPRRLSFSRHLVQKNDRRLRRAPASCTCPVLCNPVKISTAERSGDAAVPFSECKSTASFLNGKGTAGIFFRKYFRGGGFRGRKGGGRRARAAKTGRAAEGGRAHRGALRGGAGRGRRDGAGRAATFYIQEGRGRREGARLRRPAPIYNICAARPLARKMARGGLPRRLARRAGGARARKKRFATNSAQK